jgi:putative ABC transport system permease protein
MNILRQIFAVTGIGLRSLPQRLWESLVIVVGTGCVVGVLLSMLSIIEGMHRAAARVGDPRNAIVVQRNIIFENASNIPRSAAGIIANAPGIAKAKDGSSISDAVLIAYVPALLRKNGIKSNITLRSFGAKGAMLQQDFHLVAGHMFQPGKHELIAGAMANSQFSGVGLGDKVILPDGEWPIVGIFNTGGLLDGALIGDTGTLMPAIRHKSFNSVLVRLDSPAAFTTFRAALTTNPSLSVDVMRMSDWLAKGSAGFNAYFHAVVYGVAAILGLGALFGCFNSMYTAVESRGREIATLRALGYRGFPIALSVLLEGAVLSIAGAGIGAMVAWAMYDGVMSGFGSDVFILAVTPPMVALGLAWAIALAVLGGVLPSLQAARGAVSEALRAK